MAHASDYKNVYYVPHGSYWPMVGSVGLFLLAGGFAMALNGHGVGSWVSIAGAATLLVMVFGWFRDVINESVAGLYNAQVERTYRWAMGWFIFSEVMFFGAFFGALFYARTFAISWLGGEGEKGLTGNLLWPDFAATWPTAGPLELGGEFIAMGAWGLPAINTAILLTSSWTLTIAHHAIKEDNRQKVINWLAATVALGVIFLFIQGYEYVHAYQDLNLTLESGIYGSTFFMLTGFHGLHVTLGAIILAVILIRLIKGHMSADNHFAFEAGAWYWHFVDVVWVGVFIFVYIL